MSASAGETLGERWRRRAVSIPVVVLGFVGLAGLLPLLLPIALAVDLVRDRRLPAVRLLLLAVVYLGCEVFGLLGSLLLWLGSIGAPARRLRWFARLQEDWATAILRLGCRIFGIRVEVSGDDQVVPGPIVVLSRHASLADTMLPAVFVAGRHGIRLRWVLKRELLWDPCLDVAGNVLPNVFVRRGSGDATREIEAVRGLTRDLGPRDGVLIYPEGTRFTAARRERVVAALEASNPVRARRLAPLVHLLPPRPGGPLALFEACPPADIVLMAHRGLEGAASLGDLWRGSLVGRTVWVELRRVPGAAIPKDAEGRLDWLDAAWLAMDRRIDAGLRYEGSTAPDATAGR